MMEGFVPNIAFVFHDIPLELERVSLGLNSPSHGRRGHDSRDCDSITARCAPNCPKPLSRLGASPSSKASRLGGLGAAVAGHFKDRSLVLLSDSVGRWCQPMMFN